MDFFKNLLKPITNPFAAPPSNGASLNLSQFNSSTQAGGSLNLPQLNSSARAGVVSPMNYSPAPAPYQAPSQRQSNPYGVSTATSGVNAGIDPYTLTRQSPMASPYQAPQMNTNPQGVALDQYGEALLPGGIPSNPSLSINPMGENGAIPSSRIGTATYEDLFNTNNTLQNLQRKIFENTLMSQGEIDAQGRLNSANADQLTAQKQLQDEIDRLASTSNLTKEQAGSFISETQRQSQNTLANIAIRRQAESANLNALTGQRESQLAAFNALYGLNKPVSLSAGESLYNPLTGQVTASGAPKQATDELLSVTEAQALGVPYGTTKSQAYGLSPSSSKALTEDQAKAQQFATAAANADQILASSPYKVGSIELPLPNALKSGDRQMFEQASRAFVNSILRRESGASITDTEFSNKYKELIPVAGDSAAVIAQKAQARIAAVKTIANAGGNGFSTNSGWSSNPGAIVQTKAGPVNTSWD